MLQNLPGGSERKFQRIHCSEGPRPNSAEAQGVICKTLCSSLAGSSCVPPRAPSIAGVDPGRPRAPAEGIRLAGEELDLILSLPHALALSLPLCSLRHRTLTTRRRRLPPFEASPSEAEQLESTAVTRGGHPLKESARGACRRRHRPFLLRLRPPP